MSKSGSLSLSSVVSQSKTLPDRIVLYGPPGWGKTSFAARLPKPIFLMTPGEDRLKKLIEQGLCPPTPHFPDLLASWYELTSTVQMLEEQGHDYQSLVIDTGNGIERLGQEQVCHEQFGNDWGEMGFNAFAKGEKITANGLWVPFLAQLDRLRETRHMRIVLLCHTIIRSQKNPDGQDYDRIEPGLSKQAWSFTAKWADMILAGLLDISVKKESKIARGKATGGKARLLRTSPTGSIEAKNCHRLPEVINLGSDHQRAYDIFRASFPARKAPETTAPAVPAAEAPAPV